ncbi:MAG: penicillin-binding protein [Bulleidia sp.]
MKNKRKKRRTKTVSRIMIITLVTIMLLVADVFCVAIGKVHPNSQTDLSPYVDSSNTVVEYTKAMRGNLYDRNGNVIAQDAKTYNIVCILDENRPSIDGEITYVKDKEATASALSKILLIDYDKVLALLSQDIYQTELGSAGRNLSKNTKDEIEALELPGIEFTDSIQRLYPNHTFASNLIGYAIADENGSTVGQMGLELYLDSYLAGQDGKRVYQVDKNGYVLPGMKEETVSAINGNDVYLTLDAGIQQALETAFKETEQKFNATSVWGGVMEIDTGKVIAWGQSPSFDPNSLDNITNYNNIGSQSAFEPGSTMKTFDWAAAINEGKYDGSALADGNEFCWTSDADNNPSKTSKENSMGACIYNASQKKWGTVTLDDGLVYSLNTVAATIETEYITPAVYEQYLQDFGFFQKVDTDGLPESAGIKQFTWPADKLSLSYGQGSTVTMLQMFQAYSAIFSDGTMVKPYFVESIRDPYDSSNVIYQAETDVTGNPITEETAQQIQSILYDVVNRSDGTARFYKIPECELMGKTGTAEVAGNDGKYEAGRNIASVMLAMPADDPKVLVYYAFDAAYTVQMATYTEPQKSLLRKIAQVYGFSGDSSSVTAVTTDQNKDVELVETQMPSLLNHTVDYSVKQLDGSNTQLTVLGGGRNVIDQYPKTSDTLTTGDRVFLLTDTSSFEMPDLTGWTRKDVAALWSITGFGFELSGEGVVTSQSVPAGTVVTKGTVIQVVFGN